MGVLFFRGLGWVIYRLFFWCSVVGGGCLREYLVEVFCDFIFFFCVIMSWFFVDILRIVRLFYFFRLVVR